MKTKKGRIVIGIDRKVYFEPDGLPKPDQNDVKKYIENSNKYFNDLKEYEASKQLIEVSNETYPIIVTNNAYWILLHKSWIIIINGKSCKAEVNGKAKIIELIK